MKKLLFSLAIGSSILMASSLKNDITTSTTHKASQVKKHHSMVYKFNIEFKEGSTKLDPHYETKIKKFAEVLKKHPKYKATIIGYSDNKGKAKENLKVSINRAKDIYNELIKIGIDKKRLSYKGYGSKHPIASNKTAKGRAENRRVIAVVTF